MSWIEPITDRNAADINNRTKKGFLSYGDLNRIEGNSVYIGELVSLSLSMREWSSRPLIKKENLQVILDNLALLVMKWPVANLPIIPAHPLNDYVKFNQIEMIQLLLKNNIEATKSAQMRCGEGFAGEIGVI